MKEISTAVYIMFSTIVFAQYTSTEIKTNKIAKMILSSYNDRDTTTGNTVYLYDARGNDTADYFEGRLYRHYQFQYNNKGQITKKLSIDSAGEQKEVASYTYKPDGSYIISNTDAAFAMTDYTYCDKTGKILKTVTPDGTARIYTYDAKGHLMKIKSKPVDGSRPSEVTYTYDAKGKRSKEVGKGEYNWTSTFSYNAKGLLTKAVIVSVDDDNINEKATVNYTYEFWQ